MYRISDNGISMSISAPGRTRRVNWVRGRIDGFSAASRRRLVRIGRAVSDQLNAMITLTYADVPVDGRAVKADLDLFLDVLRDNGISKYLWILEFQRRGSPHFHIYIAGEIDKGAVARRWNEIVYRHRPDDETKSKHLVASTRIEAIRSSYAVARYCLKYAAKTDQKMIPEKYRDVGRFWGRSRGLKYKVESTTVSEDKLDDQIEYLIREIENGSGVLIWGTPVVWGDARKNFRKKLDKLGLVWYDELK